MSTQDTDAEPRTKEAHEEDECLLCAPAPHRNCEMYTVVPVLPDPMDVPLGEDYDDHLVEIPVCLEHYQAMEKYKTASNVAEVTDRV